MKRYFSTLVFITCVFISASACTSFLRPSPPPANSIKFSGQVLRGETFQAEVNQNLIFRLLYYDGDGEGWQIWVGEKSNTDNDFSRYVTPPFYGFNGRIIEGWHFRNADNTAPRDPDDLSVAQEIRHFYFVLNETDHEIASDSLTKILRSHNYSKEEVAEAQETYEKLNTGSGVLTITDLKLSNLTPGEYAYIESMDFNVEIQLPSVK